MVALQNLLTLFELIDARFCFKYIIGVSVKQSFKQNTQKKRKWNIKIHEKNVLSVNSL
jgi:hypothetical protein